MSVEMHEIKGRTIVFWFSVGIIFIFPVVFVGVDASLVIRYV